MDGPCTEERASFGVLDTRLLAAGNCTGLRLEHCSGVGFFLLLFVFFFHSLRYPDYFLVGFGLIRSVAQVGPERSSGPGCVLDTEWHFAFAEVE